MTKLTIIITHHNPTTNPAIKNWIRMAKITGNSCILVLYDTIKEAYAFKRLSSELKETITYTPAEDCTFSHKDILCLISKELADCQNSEIDELFCETNITGMGGPKFCADAISFTNYFSANSLFLFSETTSSSDMAKQYLVDHPELNRRYKEVVVGDRPFITGYIQKHPKSISEPLTSVSARADFEIHKTQSLPVINPSSEYSVYSDKSINEFKSVNSTTNLLCLSSTSKGSSSNNEIKKSSSCFSFFSLCYMPSSCKVFLPSKNTEKDTIPTIPYT